MKRIHFNFQKFLLSIPKLSFTCEIFICICYFKTYIFIRKRYTTRLCMQQNITLLEYFPTWYTFRISEIPQPIYTWLQTFQYRFIRYNHNEIVKYAENVFQKVVMSKMRLKCIVQHVGKSFLFYINFTNLFERKIYDTNKKNVS